MSRPRTCCYLHRPNFCNKRTTREYICFIVIPTCTIDYSNRFIIFISRFIIILYTSVGEVVVEFHNFTCFGCQNGCLSRCCKYLSLLMSLSMILVIVFSWILFFVVSIVNFWSTNDCYRCRYYLGPVFKASNSRAIW